jgi:ankyrin repeat protein
LAHEAVESGHLDILKLVIERGGIDPNSSKPNGLTVAQAAAQKGSISMLGALADRGASTNDMSTPALKKKLWAAVAQGDVQTIKTAVKAGLLTVPNSTNHQVGTSLSAPLDRLRP